MGFTFVNISDELGFLGKSSREKKKKTNQTKKTTEAHTYNQPPFLPVGRGKPAGRSGNKWPAARERSSLSSAATFSRFGSSFSLGENQIEGAHPQTLQPKYSAARQPQKPGRKTMAAPGLLGRAAGRRLLRGAPAQSPRQGACRPRSALPAAAEGPAARPPPHKAPGDRRRA